MKLRTKMIIVIVNILTIIGGMLIFSVDIHLSRDEKMKRAETLSLQKSNNKEVSALVEKYINAEFTMNKNDLKECVNNINEFSDDSLKQKSQYIEKIEKVECYTIEGYNENSYIAAVYREAKIKDMNIVSPNVFLYYVCEYDGKLVVFSGKADDNTTEYWNIFKTSNKEYLKLCEDVSTKRTALEKKYPKYKQVVALMNGTATPTPKPTPTPTAKPKSTNADKSVG